MADNPYQRSSDRRRQSAEPTGAPEQASDPLMELARLIGQDDAFALGMKPRARRWEPSGDAQSDAAPSDSVLPFPRAELGRRPAWPPERASARHAPEEDYDQYDAYRRAADDGYGDHYGQSGSAGGLPAGHGEPAHSGNPETAHASYDHQDRYAGNYQDRHAGYDYQGGEAGDYADYRHPSAARDDYDPADYGETEDEPRRRRPFVAVAALLALAVVGSAAAYGYRAFFGAAGSAPPPVIKADNAPTKLASATQANDNAASKQIYARLGEGPQGERLVPREEQPVDIVAPAPPAIGPGVLPFNMPAANGGARPAPPFPVVSPNNAPGPTATASTEPKRVRTVTIRPEQSSGTEPPPAARNAVSPPQRGSSRSTAREANAPLSLNPQAPPERANPPAERAPARERTAVASPRAGRGFVVQLSALKSEDEAQASFHALQAKYPSVLGGRQPLIRKKDLGDKGVFYGAQVGPFDSREEAVQLCEKLKSAGGTCIVQRN